MFRCEEMNSGQWRLHKATKIRLFGHKCIFILIDTWLIHIKLDMTGQNFKATLVFLAIWGQNSRTSFEILSFNGVDMATC